MEHRQPNKPNKTVAINKSIFIDLRVSQAREAALHLLETSEDVDATAQNRSLGACLAAILTAELGRLALILLHKETDPEKQWKLFCQINRELSRLRRDDDRAKRSAMAHKNPSDGSDRLSNKEPHPSKPEAGPNLVTMALNNLDPDYDTQIRLPGSIIGPETAALLNRMKFSNHPASTLQPIMPSRGSAGLTSLLAKNPTNPQKSNLIKAAKG